ncbi:TerC family protein [Herpetosiphon geysericola]|uniref:Tellurium resistance protein TerC n=1 Tax=Herpetosiphon geysericola TaxID=70996 RepID=A0A0N8GTE5_9CHLR|nr:DUF475 domain-containing protein [Herpetosiphon geysericola]KPL91874.1 tellurium resistance protein TerC [Herpetosiphon geysericola]
MWKDIFDILQIVFLLVFLEGILSIDNAAVLGAMVAHLPQDQPIPWPKWLQWMQGHGERFLGMQQAAALKVGLIGAYVGRGLMLAVAFIITENPWVLAIGSGYLVWLSVNHFAHLYRRDQVDEHGTTKQRVTGFWQTVLIIEMIDLAFSLDNVVVAVSADPQKRFWVIGLGVAIGILVMRFAAQIFTNLIEWEPNLEHAAFALLLAIGAESVIKIVWHVETPHWLKFAISMTILALTVGLSRLPFLKPLKKFLRLGLPLASIIDTVVGWLLWPIRWLFGLLLAPFRQRVAARIQGE